jgi:glycosyltransferase involved in cell wall biosynthesis
MSGERREANGMRAAEELLRANGMIPPDEVWVHGMWTPRVWKECLGALRAGRPLVRMTHGSLSPIYLERQSMWKKRLVSPIERILFAHSTRVVATGPWEEEWCRRWGLKCPIQIVDLKQFFSFPRFSRGQSPRLKVLYLGRIHPLKGVDVLKEAVEGLDIDLRVESTVFDGEKERALEWCDVLVLPSMSENFGFVVAEALMHGRRAVTTDGAPAWENQPGVAYVRGYRDAAHGEQVRLLREALEREIAGGAE